MSDSINPLEIPPIERLDRPRRQPGEHSIVVGIQFDATGENALQHALKFVASWTHAEVHVAHVIADQDRSVAEAVIARHLKDLERVPAQLREFVALHDDGESHDFKYHVRIGDPVETLLQLALDYDAEVIVVGTHGRKGMQKLMLGSVAQKLVEAGRCAVLIATPRDFKGMNPTPIPDPMCPDCETARAASGGQKLWCEYHARPHVHPHTVGGNHGGLLGGHDPGIVP